MNSIMNIALSGMRAAELRVQTSANNIANAVSTRNGKNPSGPYIPQDVIQLSDDRGGVIAYTTPSNKGTNPVFDPGHVDADEAGVVQYPNVDLAEELVKAQEASFIYKSNLKAIDRQSAMMGALLNMSV